ncbi:hypothetical protein [Candidatus Similichlamydia laticola]|uniref:Uncharacterized protein n=1 Tax=Candidatus Similichlamydia laticola TaxID=2170265 RepID=A0A369KEJ1_9BACT|nr:hypothetical protein [Candidatus Similichlamydia laticola]RDB31317.1 hypothetical protein HAT2_00573 [Candidatus Similichlamydia laticola]
MLDQLVLDDPQMEEHYQIDKAIIYAKSSQTGQAERILRRILGMGHLVHVQIKNRAAMELAKVLTKKDPKEALQILDSISPKKLLDQKEKNYLAGVISREKGDLERAKKELLLAIGFPQYALWKEDALFHLTEILDTELHQAFHATLRKIWKQIEEHLQSYPTLRRKTILNLSRIDAEINTNFPTNPVLYAKLKEELKSSPPHQQGEVLYFLVQGSLRSNLPEDSAQFLGLLQSEQFENTPWPSLAWLYLTSHKILEGEEGAGSYHQTLSSAFQAIEKTGNSLFKKKMDK